MPFSLTPGGSRRTARRGRGPRVALVAGIVVACLALALPGIAAAASRVPGATRTPAGRPVPPCVAGQLAARVLDWQGAAGSRIADVELVNTSFVHCSIRDLPGVQLVSAHGVVMINGAAPSTTAHTHGLVPLGFLKTEVSDGNYCGPAFFRPVTLAFVLPAAAGRVVAVPVSPTDAGGVPPCLGPGSAGRISIHAWHT